MSTTHNGSADPDYTLKNLNAVDDMASKFGVTFGEARFPREDLGLAETGCAYYRVNPGARQEFGHKHDQAEEVYLVLGGSGRVKIEGDVIELQELDALRVAPAMTRAFEAGPDGLQLLAFGARHEGDGDIIPGWWTD